MSAEGRLPIMSEAQRERVLVISRELDRYRQERRPRQYAERIAEQLVDLWDTIYSNWTADDLDFGDLPEERALYEERFRQLGEAVLGYAELMLVPDGL